MYTSFVVANVCYILNVYQLDYLTSAIQPLIFLLAFWLLFKIRFLYSLLIVVITYSINALYEYIFIQLLAILKLSLDDKHYLLAIATFIPICNILLSVLLRKYRIGFSFISSNKSSVIIFNNYKTSFIFSILGLISITLTGLSFLYVNSVVLLAHLIILLILGFLLRISYSEELKNA
jgi:hypothetical protein